MKFDELKQELLPDEKAHFLTMLQGQLDELMDDTDDTISEMKDATLEFPDPADRANYEFERNTTLRIRDRERKLIKKISEAIDRVENDCYNECEECGESIGKLRLDARPVTTYCIHCKEQQEQAENTRQG